MPDLRWEKLSSENAGIGPLYSELTEKMNVPGRGTLFRTIVYKMENAKISEVSVALATLEKG